MSVLRDLNILISISFAFRMWEKHGSTSHLNAPLVLGDPEQLHGPPLVGGVPYDLPDEISHEAVVVGLPALATGGALLGGVWRRLVTLVQARTDLVAGSHRDICLQWRGGQ